MGATAVYVAVRAERDPDPIRNFSTFTGDLHAVANWLKECQITTVAMESTGVYWIPVHQILEAHGFVVVLVNARHVHSVPGRKSDVADCEWLRYLHTCTTTTASSPHRSAKTCNASNAGSEQPDWLFLRSG